MAPPRWRSRPHHGIAARRLKDEYRDPGERDGAPHGPQNRTPITFARPADQHLGELVARVRALGRRSGVSIPPLLAAADVVVDTTRRLAFRNGQRVPLARKELAVLEILLAANGGVVSAEELLERAWDDQTDPFTNVVRMTMMKLRRKLGHPSIIETVVGEGYRIP